MTEEPIFDVSGFPLGGSECFVIAEIGSNHTQDIALAKEHIDAAVECGANAVKFQSIQLNELYLDASDETAQLINALRMDEEWVSPLKRYCDERDIVFFSSPTYLAAVKTLQDAQVTLYKVASAQVGTFPQLVQSVASTGRPALLSTGIATASDIERAIRMFEAAGNPNYVLLHCNSIYPTPPRRVNLGLMEAYRKLYRCPVGFSDHTEDIYVPIAAVALGAKVLEKHFALSRKLPGPDAAQSIEPKRFSEMVRGIREVEAALCPASRVSLENEEVAFKEAILYRLVLQRDVEKNTVLSERDFRFLRHADGVDCRDLEFLLERNARAARKLNNGDLLQWRDILFS